MSQAIDTLHPIDRMKLHPVHYVESLIDQAMTWGLLSESDCTIIQADLLELLAGQCDKWSSGESSSLPTEKAQDILTSILFVVGIKLKNCSSPEYAVGLLKSEKMEALFEEGLRIIRRKKAVSGHIQNKIVRKMLDTPNEFYRSTIADGINGFFKLYNPQFTAHEIHITADYPTFAGRPESQGIEFIEDYLCCIEAENDFCTGFQAQDIHHLMCGLTSDYTSIPMNIFEYVMLSALGLALVKRNPAGLNLTNENVEELYRFFSNKSGEEIPKCLEEGILALKEYGLMPKTTELYLHANMEKLVSIIANGAEMNTFHKHFLVPSYPELETKITFDYSSQMDNNKYRKLVKKLLQMERGEEKIALILQQINSLADLMDIISDAELSEEELNLLVNMLPLSIFTLLLSQYPEEDLPEREREQMLYRGLSKRKERLTDVEKNAVNQAVKKLQKSK